MSVEQKRNHLRSIEELVNFFLPECNVIEVMLIEDTDGETFMVKPFDDVTKILFNIAVETMNSHVNYLK